MDIAAESLPLRGAWIEIEIAAVFWIALLSRSPCGERGLKYAGAEIYTRLMEYRRSPCGERGLKLL